MNSSVAGWHVNKRAVRVQAARLKPDDHSELVPLLPIPNRTVKRLCADDSADSRVKVGHRQAHYSSKRPRRMGALFFAFAVRCSAPSAGVLEKFRGQCICKK